MKIASALSGLLVVVLLILFFTGIITFENGVYESITKGNRSFAENNYEQALNAYNTGLSKNAEDSKLNYNSGQASYLLNKYGDAEKYYAKAFETPDKYLNSGNSSLKLADAASDDAQKQQYLRQALETFKQGIISFPENIPLKYNYEYVKNKLGDQQNNNEQNQENKENQEQNKQDENSEQNEQNGDSQQNEQNKDSQQNESSGQEDNPEQNQEKSENQQDAQSDQNKEQQDAQTGAQNEENNSEQDLQAADQSDSSQSEQSDSQIANVLKMLEKQEEDSLKNNQEEKRSTEGDEYDW